MQALALSELPAVVVPLFAETNSMHCSSLPFHLWTKLFRVMRVQPFKVCKCKLIILLLVMLAFHLHVNLNCLWCFCVLHVSYVTKSSWWMLLCEQIVLLYKKSFISTCVHVSSLLRKCCVSYFLVTCFSATNLFAYIFAGSVSAMVIAVWKAIGAPQKIQMGPLIWASI